MSTIYPALNANTAGSSLPVMEYVELAARHNFTSVELNGDRIEPLVNMDIQEGRDFLGRLGISIASFDLPVEWRKDESTFQDGMHDLPLIASAARILGATRCCTWVVPNYPTLPADSRRWIGARFRAIREVLASDSIRFGLEFIGPLHYLSEPGRTFIRGMQDMLAFAEDLGSNAGLLVDSFHWHCLGNTEEDLAAVPAERIIYVHINDAPNVPVEEQQDEKRLLPGEGIINLSAFVRGLAKAGYEGPVGIEVPTSTLKNATPDEAAALARQSWNSMIEAVA